MGDNITSGLVCFDFRRSAALHCWVCSLRSENDLKRQSLTVPEPINYPTYWKLLPYTHHHNPLKITNPTQRRNFKNIFGLSRHNAICVLPVASERGYFI
jgi:hypothetical protein